MHFYKYQRSQFYVLFQNREILFIAELHAHVTTLPWYGSDVTARPHYRGVKVKCMSLFLAFVEPAKIRKTYLVFLIRFGETDH